MRVELAPPAIKFRFYEDKIGAESNPHMPPRVLVAFMLLRPASSHGKENVMFLKTERFLTIQIKTTRYVGRVQVLFNKSPSKTYKTVNITEK